MKRDLFAPVRSSLIVAFLMKSDLFAPIKNFLSLPSHKELPYLCLLNEEGPIRSHEEPLIFTLP